MDEVNAVNKRADYIDFLKGIAIIMVVLVHFIDRIPNLSTGMAWIGLYGQMGCQLFFCIGGYLTCKSLERKRAGFWKKRLFRIIPKYYFAIILNLIAIWIFRDYIGAEINFPRTDIINILGNLIFMQHWMGLGFSCMVAGSWYIFDYLLFSLITMIVSNLVVKKEISERRKYSIILLLINLVFVFAIVGISIWKGRTIPANNDRFYGSIFIQGPAWLLGVVLYYNEKLKAVGSGLRICLAIIFFGLSFCCFISSFSGRYAVVPTLASFSYYYTIGVAKKYYCNKLKICNLIEKFGKSSYDILITHSFVTAYGVRVIRVLLERSNCNVTGDALFWILFLPSCFVSYILALLFDMFFKTVGGLLHSFKEHNRY